MIRHFASCAILLVALAVCGCAEPVTVKPPLLSNRQRSNLIEKLQSAKATDWNCVMSDDVAKASREDCLDQMRKADRVIKELRYGFDVAPSRINDALWLPPKTMTNADRVRLIAKLEEARRQDDHNEQVMLNDLAWGNSDFPADTSTFDDQKALVDGVIKDLEIGEDVRWSTVKEALYVPPSPY
ncbi:MAG TPA: hypothetical protein VMT61_18125 [Candidatus Binataceae bacterium]|nr:hypothetical protein [Candidatus Binataceae bacterium]